MRRRRVTVPLDPGTDRPPHPGCRGVTLVVWTRETRSASSSPPDEPRSRPSSRACRPSAVAGVFRGSGGRRLRSLRGSASLRVRPSVQRTLDAMTAAPAFVRNGRMDILAANRLGRAFYAQHFDSPHEPANSARFIFLDPRATDFYVDWEQVATDAVAVLRSEAGRDPRDRGLSDF